MTSFSRNVHRANAAIRSYAGFNPKFAYSTVRGVWQRFNYEVFGRRYRLDNTAVNIAFPEQGLMITGIPLVASRSLLWDLGIHQAAGSSLVFSEPLTDLLQRKPELDSYYKVGIVRNPWVRTVSVYNKQICHPKKTTPYTYFVRYKGLYYKMPFEEFVGWLCLSKEGRDEVADRHWASQVCFLYHNANPIVDEIILMEFLSSSLSDLIMRFSIKEALLRNKSPSWEGEGRDYRIYYNDRTRDLISARYSKDISFFEFDF